MQKRKVLSLEWKSEWMMDDESGELMELAEEVPLKELPRTGISSGTLRSVIEYPWATFTFYKVLDVLGLIPFALFLRLSRQSNDSSLIDRAAFSFPQQLNLAPQSHVHAAQAPFVHS